MDIIEEKEGGENILLKKGGRAITTEIKQEGECRQFFMLLLLRGKRFGRWGYVEERLGSHRKRDTVSQSACSDHCTKLRTCAKNVV